MGTWDLQPVSQKHGGQADLWLASEGRGRSCGMEPFSPVGADASPDSVRCELNCRALEWGSPAHWWPEVWEEKQCHSRKLRLEETQEECSPNQLLTSFSWCQNQKRKLGQYPLFRQLWKIFHCLQQIKFNNISKGECIMTKWGLSQEGKNSLTFQNQPMQFTTLTDYKKENHHLKTCRKSIWQNLASIRDKN